MREEGLEEVRFFFTHSHWDHLTGFPFFAPAYSPHYRLRFCGGPHAQETIRRYLNHQMQAPYFPVEFRHLRSTCVFECAGGHERDGACGVGACQVEQVPLSHPNGGFGFKFREGDRSFVFLTDNELGQIHPGGLEPAGYVSFCRDADLLFHDAQYTDGEYERTRGWGHSTYGDAVDLAMAAGVRRLGLFHHDPQRSDDDLERQLAWCQTRIRESGSELECFAVAEGMTLTL